MSVIVRFAPSPTGYLHIGGARTALFNYLFAKNNNGKFLLRIEDTDAARSNKEAIAAIVEGLDWLNLKYDDEVVFQSKNIHRHRQIAEELIEKNQAYYCYTSAEELEEMRKNAEKKNEVFRFKSPWRNKINSQSSSIKPVVRIKAPIEGETIIEDLVQGKVVVKNSELDDFVILRSDQTPTYMLAVVVDDFDMNITHIIRGDDHLTNAFRQKIIFDAMNWRTPFFAHIPLIHGADGAKLSKRHGATSVVEYKKMGYLPQAIRNYLLRLGFSFGDLEIIADEKAKEIFTLKNVGKSAARFDFAKLNNLNKHYIKEENEDQLFKLIAEFFVKMPNENEILRIKKALSFIKERSETLTDLAKNLAIYFDDLILPIDEKDQKILAEKKDILSQLTQEIEKISNWQIDEIKKAINNFAENKNLKIKDFGLPLRIAITFSSASGGGIFEVVEILGQKEVLKRISNSIK
jgi:glutamyl-tRNA synthetase